MIDLRNLELKNDMREFYLHTKVLVIGHNKVSRDAVFTELDNFMKRNGLFHILLGGSKRVNMYAKEYAKMNNLLYKSYTPNYKDLKSRALGACHKIMISEADYTIAFWNETNDRTLYLLNKSREANTPTKIVFFSTQAGN